MAQNQAARATHQAAASRGSMAQAAASPTPEADDELAAQSIPLIRKRIDAIDAAIIQLWRERAMLSQQIGVIRVAAGGTRLVLSREREILERFHEALGADGTQLALLVLQSGRGPL